MLIRVAVWDPPCNFPLGSQMMMATTSIRGTVWISVPLRVSAELAPWFLGRIGGSQLPLLASQRRSNRVFRRPQSVEMRMAEP